MEMCLTGERMRTTVDIPDSKYRELKMKAAAEGRSVREIVLRGIEHELAAQPQPVVHRKKKRFVSLPIVKSKRPGTLHITNEQIYDIVFP